MGFEDDFSYKRLRNNNEVSDKTCIYFTFLLLITSACNHQCLITDGVSDLM